MRIKKHKAYDFKPNSFHAKSLKAWYFGECLRAKSIKPVVKKTLPNNRDIDLK